MSVHVRVSDGRIDAVARLLRSLPDHGMSSEALSKIGRLKLETVEAALARLETSGVVVRRSIIKDGRVIELWVRV